MSMNNCTAGEAVVSTVCYVLIESTTEILEKMGFLPFQGTLLRTFFLQFALAGVSRISTCQMAQVQKV